MDDKGREKCREAHLGGMRAATEHSCFSAQYRCALESELYSCGVDLHVAHYGCCCYLLRWSQGHGAVLYFAFKPRQDPPAPMVLVVMTPTQGPVALIG